MYCPECKSENITEFESELKDSEGNEFLHPIYECGSCETQFMIVEPKIN